jgi:hypothetical protein
MRSRLPLALLAASLACASLSGAPVQPENRPPKGVPVVKLHFAPCDPDRVVKRGSVVRFSTPQAYVVNYDEAIRGAAFYGDIRVLHHIRNGHRDTERWIAKVWVNRADALPVVQRTGRPALAWGLLKIKLSYDHHEPVSQRGRVEWIFLLPDTKLVTAGPSGAPTQPKEKLPKGVPALKMHFPPMDLDWCDQNPSDRLGTPHAFFLNIDEVSRVATFYADVRERKGMKFYGPGHSIAKVWVDRADALPVVQKNGRPALAWGALKVRFGGSGYEPLGRCGRLEWVFLLPEARLITGSK